MLACQSMFCFLHDIGHAQLQRICSHVDENLDSIKPRGHGNKAKLPHNTTEFQEIEHIRDFILNTGRVRGMPLPGRLPGLRETEAYYLPADETQIEVYKQYKVAAEGENRTPVKYSTFRNFWHDLVPDVKILTPSTDLCDVCQENSKKLAYSGHLSEEEKRERLEQGFSTSGSRPHLGSPSDFRGVARLSPNFLKNDIRTEKCWPNSPTYSTDVGVLRGWGRAQITVQHFGSQGKKG